MHKTKKRTPGLKASERTRSKCSLRNARTKKIQAAARARMKKATEAKMKISGMRMIKNLMNQPESNKCLKLML